MKASGPLRAILLVSLTCLPPAFHGADAGRDWTPLDQWLAAQAAHRQLHVSFLQTRRLPTIKREQTQPGELWYAAPDQFRWQLGEPLQVIALRQGEQALVLQPQKKRGQRLDAATGQRGTEYLMMMRHPLAADRAEFLQKFELKSLQTRDGKLLLDLLPRDTGARQHLRSMQLNVDPPSGILERMELHFRDGASLITQTTKVIVNGGTVPAVFQLDLSDYQIKD